MGARHLTLVAGAKPQVIARPTVGPWALPAVPTADDLALVLAWAVAALNDLALAHPAVADELRMLAADVEVAAGDLDDAVTSGAVR